MVWMSVGAAVLVAAIVLLVALNRLPRAEEQPAERAAELFSTSQRCETTLAVHAITVEIPGAWWSNPSVGGTPACVWYAPQPLDVPVDGSAPAGVAVSLGSAGGPPMPTSGHSSVISRHDLAVGGRPVIRIEGTLAEPEGEERTQLTYWIPLGKQGGGPTLVAITSTDNAGDYELNKAVLDEMVRRLSIVAIPGD